MPYLFQFKYHNLYITASVLLTPTKQVQKKQGKVAQIVSSKQLIIPKYKPSFTLQTPQGHG
jgi:hypothetical protein